MINKDLYINQYEEEYLVKMQDVTVVLNEIADKYKNIEQKKRLPDLLGKTLKVSKYQFKDIYYIALNICNELDMEIPDIYIYEDVYYRIESVGVDKPWIEISANILEDFSIKELIFILSKEICGIHLGHTYYQTLIDYAMDIYRKGNSLPFSDIFNESIYINMCRWSRVSNYTSDNFGYIMTKDINVCINTLLKLLFNSKYMIDNININEFIKQAEELNLLNDSVYNNSKLDERIPYGPFRIKNLIAYACSKRGLITIREGVMVNEHFIK